MPQAPLTQAAVAKATAAAVALPEGVKPPLSSRGDPVHHFAPDHSGRAFPLARGPLFASFRPTSWVTRRRLPVSLSQWGTGCARKRWIAMATKPLIGINGDFRPSGRRMRRALSWFNTGYYDSISAAKV